MHPQNETSFNKAQVNISLILDDEYLLNRDPLHVVVPLTVVYSIIFITGVVGNVGTCIVIARNKHMHTATNYYLFSLAISDILLLVSGLPAETFILWSKHKYVFGESFCILKGLIAESSANATVLTVTSFTVERYVAVCHPFRAHSLSKLSRAVKIIGYTWGLSTLLAVPLAIQFGVVHKQVLYLEVSHCTLKSAVFEKLFILSSFVVFVLPMTVIIVLYILISMKLRVSSRMAGKRSSLNSESREPVRSNAAAYQKHIIRMLVAVVVAFFICWAPFHAQRLIALYLKNWENLDLEEHPTLLVFYESLLHVSGILYYLSTTINPLLYNIMSYKFRLAFRTTLSRTCTSRTLRFEKRSSNGTLRTYSQRTQGRTETTAVLVSYKKEKQPANLNAKPATRCLSSELNATKSEIALTCISCKLLPHSLSANGIFFNKKTREGSKGERVSTLTISNSSLHDVDPAEFSSTELANIMARLKMQDETALL